MRIKYFTPALFLVFLLAGCAKIQEPEFRRVDNFRLKGIGLSGATVGFTITYFNPNNFTMTVKETEAQVALDGVDLGKFAQDTTVEVGAKAEFSIPISGTVPFNKATQLNIQNLSSREVQVNAVGSTKVGKAGIFITKPFTYSGKHRIDEVRF